MSEKNKGTAEQIFVQWNSVSIIICYYLVNAERQNMSYTTNITKQ